MPADAPGPSDAVADSAAEALNRARSAADGLAAGQSGPTSVARAVADALAAPDRAASLAAAAVGATDVGHPAARQELFERQLRGVADGLPDGADENPAAAAAGAATGAIAAIVGPVTPATATAMWAVLAVRRGVGLAVSPRGTARRPVRLTVAAVRRALADAGAPVDLAVVAPPTGSDGDAPAVCAVADTCGPTTGSARDGPGTTGGPGRTPPAVGDPRLDCDGPDGQPAVVSIVDGTADAGAVAARLASGATFDYGGLPAADDAVVVVEDAYPELFRALEKRGAYRLDPRDARQLRGVLFADNRPTVGRSPPRLAGAAALPPAARRAGLFLLEDAAADPPFVTRSPVLAVRRADGFEDAVATADRFLRADGAGSGCILHTGRPGRAGRVARSVSAPRLAINVPGTAFAGSADAGIPFTPTLGRTLLADAGGPTRVARRGRA